MHTREFAIGIPLPTHHVGCTDARVTLFLPFAARPFASGGHFSLKFFVCVLAWSLYFLFRDICSTCSDKT